MERKPTDDRTPLLAAHPSINGLQAKRVVHLPVRFSYENVKQLNRPSHLPYLFSDAYYYLVSASWLVFWGVITTSFFVTSFVYAGLFYAARHQLTPRPTFWGLFFFSIQLLVGKDGNYAPTDDNIAAVLIVIAGIQSLLILALLTGIVYARFSRPNARIMFSKHIVISTFNSQPHMMLRIANSRTTHIHELQAKVFLVRTETTTEGGLLTRMYDLKLARKLTPTFAVYPWTLMHMVNAESPLSQMNTDDLIRTRTRIVVLVTGVDSMLSDVVHQEHTYYPDQIVLGGKFVDMFLERPNGERCIDYAKFDQIDYTNAEALIVRDQSATT